MKVRDLKEWMKVLPDDYDVQVCGKHHWKDALWSVGLVLWIMLLILSIFSHFVK